MLVEFFFQSTSFTSTAADEVEAYVQNEAFALKSSSSLAAASAAKQNSDFCINGRSGFFRLLLFPAVLRQLISLLSLNRSRSLSLFLPPVFLSRTSPSSVSRR